MDISQIPYLTALLSAALVKKKTADVEMAHADWTMLKPYLIENDLQIIASAAFRTFPEYAHDALPHSRELSNLGAASSLEAITRDTALIRLAMEWAKTGKCLLGVGGLAYGRNYPVARMHGGHTLVCTALTSTKELPQSADDAEYDCGNLHVRCIGSLVPQGTDEDASRAAEVLNEAFFGAPCRKFVTGAVVPNALFTAIYLLHGAYSQMSAGTMTIRTVVDWAMVLYAGGERDKDLDWEALIAKCETLGIVHFVKVLTAAAVRLTGVDLPDGAKSLADASDADVMVLLASALEPEQTEATSRWDKFCQAIRHRKVYSRVMAVSPVSKALRALFR